MHTAVVKTRKKKKVRYISAEKRRSFLKTEMKFGLVFFIAIRAKDCLT